MCDRINSLGFCAAAAIFSQTATGRAMEPYERNRILSDFHDGAIDVVCAVDIFNEGVDVPDVNIIVFQRVTDSRRIFVQQLGRGLRLAPGKDKVIVLDFVSDVRRFAAVSISRTAYLRITMIRRGLSACACPASSPFAVSVGRIRRRNLSFANGWRTLPQSRMLERTQVS